MDNTGYILLNLKYHFWHKLVLKVNQNDLRNNDQLGDVEMMPHITLIGGLNHDLIDITKLKKDLKKFLSKNKRIPKIELDGVGYFDSNPEYNVLYYKVKKNLLLDQIHNHFKNAYPNNYSFETYKPHITIAYLNKNADIRKYVRKITDGMEFPMPYEFVYSDPNMKKTTIHKLIDTSNNRWVYDFEEFLKNNK